jgi:hypothetical protein
VNTPCLGSVGLIAISMYGGRVARSGSRQEIGFGLTYMLDLSSFGRKSLLSLWNLDKRFRIFWRARCSIFGMMKSTLANETLSYWRRCRRT